MPSIELYKMGMMVIPAFFSILGIALSIVLVDYFRLELDFKSPVMVLKLITTAMIFSISCYGIIKIILIFQNIQFVYDNINIQ